MLILKVEQKAKGGNALKVIAESVSGTVSAGNNTPFSINGVGTAVQCDRNDEIDIHNAFNFSRSDNKKPILVRGDTELLRRPSIEETTNSPISPDGSPMKRHGPFELRNEGF